MTKKQSQAFIYILIPIFIVVWWILAFRNTPAHTNATHTLTTNVSYKDPVLYPIKREQLHHALQGDFSLMAELIFEWDINAQILFSKGISNIKRLPPDQFLQSQILLREIKNKQEENLTNSTLEGNRFIPQTHMAASFLLSLVSPEQIIALPSGMREQLQVYPAEKMNQIPLNIDRHQSEKLFLSKPAVAFVAPYTHPATYDAFQQQGIPLFLLPSPNTMEDLESTLITLGTVTNRLQEATLLKIFMNSAFLAIDNELIAHDNKKEKILYLNYYSQFAFPTSKTLIGQLLEKMPITLVRPHLENHAMTNEWKQPITQEQILQLNPDLILFSTTQPQRMNNLFNRSQALSSLSAVKQKKIFFLDETVQESPSQYIVLAYYDIAAVMQR